ncbi:glycosyltransferase family 39 protein [Candidatus Solincola tengchongensis]|uniref:glycosyltransferase family 39 protein n=1 Tax=Candidatus Solincola tengchongensis TaxID=2900693 RepID=UPI00257997F8|nr:glycosyltransferase family 39 protein [Candidatus Solincola tengchongensis]
MLLTFFLLLHILKSLFLGVHVDEANWWMQSRHLSAGYYFHPPFTAFLVRVGTFVFGDGAVGLRMAHLLLAAASLALAYLLCREMGLDGRWSFFTVLLLACLPFTNYWITMVVVDTPMIFFALLFAILAWRAIAAGESGYWYLAGISVGFMLLSKLQSVLFILGILFFLVTSPGFRSHLKRKEPYLAMVLALLILTPTIAWYAVHHFEPIIYQLTSRPGFLHSGPGDYLVKVAKHAGWEALSLSPFVYLFSIIGLVCGGYLGFRRRKPELLFLFWLALPGTVFFTLTGGPPRWGFSSHLFSLVLAMASASLLMGTTPSRRSRQLQAAAYWGLFLIPCLAITSLTLYLSASSTVHSGWKEVAGAVDALASAEEGGGGTAPVVASPYYFISSEIAYHQRGHPLEYTIAFLVYENEVMCDNSSYSPWVPLDRLEGRDFLFVDERDNPDGFQTPASFWEAKLAPYFREVEEPVVLRLSSHGREREIYIFRCSGFKGPDAEMDSRGEARRYVENPCGD